ncbi:glucose-1-phosphate adenylyltransferase [Rhodohalobacter sp. 614A]|uniref:glucose-1-phosphate adenylyltransferase n=1 Tax=Rhodohalobacter sp. 614A TaxID=2908649 RepID=UPI001F4009E7|nr:glucose-1-phosphate adenylyltransferase [Rhodohalobacter sp. 614A]
MEDKTIAIILGGGRGTRLDPLTRHRSKPAVPIAGKYRLVDIPISNCLNSWIRKIFVLTQFNSASLNRHIKNTYNFDLFSHGFVDILAAEQTPKSTNWFQGTADAVRQSLHHLANYDYDHVLVLSGDQLYQMDYRKLLEVHDKENADVTIATLPVTAEEATGFGIMKTNEDGLIESFVEKPSSEELAKWASDTAPEMKAKGKEYLASMGIYVFSKDIMLRLFDENPDATDFGKEIIPKAIEEGSKVSSYLFNGYWTDIGTISSFFDANLELSNTVPAFNLYDNEQVIYTRARYLPASKLTGTSLERVLIAEGCIIEASRIEQSVIGIRARIGKGTTIENSIVMGNDTFATQEDIDRQSDRPMMGIGQRCFISRAILDKNVRIGNDVKIVGGPHLEDGEYEKHSVVDGIVIIQKGEVIPDGYSI